MPAATRLGDICTGHPPCYPARPNIVASTNVFVNNKGWHRQGDGWAEHCCVGDCHPGVLTTGSPNVFVNNKQAGRIGDPVNCGSFVATGSVNVFANG